MAQQARERQALTIAPRYQKPPGFAGTEVAWRSLCDTYPSAETPEVLLALIEYCAVRKLDPYKRPCHVVPMWNSKLRRRVQVIMQGILEVETTASRTGKWAGMDEPKWGETVKRTFRGEVDNDDGSKGRVEVTMEYPLWCSVTVYRLVGEQRAAFTEQLFWDECYAKAAFRTEVPNARWQQAPRQMLHKCCKASVLRAAFPEEGLDYTQEEMEDRETDVGGVVIDGKAEQPPPSQQEIERDRMADAAYPPKLQPLEEPNGTVWLRNLKALLDAATSADEVAEIAGHASVHKTLAADSSAPTLIRRNIEDALCAAHERLAPAGDEAHDDPPAPGTWDGDPAGELLAEIATMDAVTLAGLADNAAWRAKVSAAIEGFPPDEDRIRDAIEARRLELKRGGTGR